LERRGPVSDGIDVVDVIFVHGLGGDPIKTWTSSSPPTDFWPTWLASDVGGVQLWTLKWPSQGYSFTPSGGLSVVDVAHATLQLMDSHDLGGRPIVFICHSMGGILVKQMLQSAATLGEKAWEQIFKHTAGVIFIATPHNGSSLANILQYVPKVPSMRTHELGRNDSALRLLHTWFRMNAPALNIATLTFFETRKVGPVLIVDQTSADSDVPGSIAIAVDANHFNICKPSSRDDPVYLAVKHFIKRLRPIHPPVAPNLAASGLIDAFRASYLYSSDHSVVFGGRQHHIVQLNEWLIDENLSRRMLITGPTGRGKSALLVRWIEQLGSNEKTAQWHTVFVPISIRFGTCRPSVFYKLLAQELARHLARPLGAPSSDPEEFYLGEVAAMLKDVNESGAKVVVVIDGLDETIGDAFNASVFPAQMLPTLKIILSARQIAGDAGPEGWKARLGWCGNDGNDSIELLGLDLEGVREALASTGLDLTTLPATLPERILELSGGEPLLVQLYVEDVTDLAVRNQNVSLEQLGNGAPGYGPYILRWLEQQEHAWNVAGEAINRRSIDAALAVLSAAFGPLQKEDFIRLVSNILDEAEPLSAASYIAPIRRFVIGRGTEKEGYVLSHPKLGQYLSEEYFPSATMKRAHEAFVWWGENALRQVAGGQQDGQLVVPYLLQHYVHHLNKIGASLQHYAELLKEGWARAWEAFEGGYRGYSSDLRNVLERIGKVREWAGAQSQASEIKIRASLILSSIRSIGTNYPAELLRLALEEELLTWKQVAYYIELQLPENQSSFVVESFAHIPLDEQETAINHILETKDTASRIQSIARVLDAVSPSGRETLIVTATSLLSRVENPYQRISLTADLTRWSPQLADGIYDALQAQSVPIEHLAGYANTFARISISLEAVGRSGSLALEQSLQLIAQIPDPVDQLLSVWNVALICGLSAIQSVANSVIEAARQPVLDRIAAAQAQGPSMMAGFKLASAITALAKLTLLSARDFGETQYEQSLSQALGLLHDIVDWEQARAVTELIPMVRSSHVASVFERAKSLVSSLRSGNNRTHAYLALSKCAPSTDRKQLICEALNNARLIEDQVVQIRARIALYSRLPSEQRKMDRDALLAEISQVAYVVHRAELYMSLAANENEMLKAQLHQVSYSLLKMAADPYIRVNETVNLFRHSSESFRKQALAECMEVVKDINPPEIRAFVIQRLADEFEGLWSSADLESALRMLPTTGWDRAHALPALIPIANRFGVAKVMLDTMALAISAPDLHVRLNAVRALLPHMADDDARSQMLDNVWQFAATLNDQSQQASAWVKLLDLYPIVEMEKQRDTLNLVMQMQGNWKLLETMSLKATSDAEREELLSIALTSAMQERLDTAVNAAAEIAVNTKRMDTRMAAFEFITSQPTISRSTLLNAMQQLPDAIMEIGGVNLIRKVSQDISEVGSTWT
jgi:hypothetical protein